jgi:hypothetical protein
VATDPAKCGVPECGRRVHARRLCQTHWMMSRRGERLKEIRPYRQRSVGTLKFAGLRLTPRCARRISDRAGERQVSVRGTICEILEEWAIQ